ncbi:uncharacterized protein PG986_011153 [Apiospora aurea]|uniref:Uncharacterized protein n=1 Tax=Apiospora aurea TaxID=335848 RepID=A0ABR1Q498_9PEZI
MLTSSQPSGGFLSDTTWATLQVQSKSLEWLDTGLSTPPPSDDGRPKRRKMHFADDCTPTGLRPVIGATVPASPEEVEDVPSRHGDIGHSKLCFALQPERLPAAQTRCAPCLGYIENSNATKDGFRHSFYRDIPDAEEYCGLITMGQMLSKPLEHSVSIVQQLQLARDLAVTVLRFHSTPWLGSYLTTRDLVFVKRAPSVGFNHCLQTLHLVSNFTQRDDVDEDKLLNVLPMETTDDAEAEEDARLLHGVRNVTLWYLGAILLQIACWRDMDATTNDVLTVRRLSSHVFAMGPKYQELTKKCLDCDIGYGDDLSKPRLQQAVYKNIICELTDMIERLDVDPDS